MRFSLLTTLVLLCFQPLFGQTEKDVASEISEVTVFLSGAQVTREATVMIETGKNDLYFRGLATGINAKNIQVTAPPEVMINSVIHQVNYLNREQNSPQVNRLRDSLQILNDLIQMAQDEQAVLQNESKLILANQRLAGKERGVTVVELEKAANFYRSRLTNIEDLLFKSRKKVVAHQRAQRRITAQLRELKYTRNRPSNDIRVVVNSFSRRKVTLRLRYMVQEAGWVPGYDLRATDIQSPIRIDYRADVYQNTGIDWSKVNLTLSSGNPQQGGVQPNLQPWSLYAYQHREVKYKTSYMRESVDEAPVSEEEEMMEDEATDDWGGEEEGDFDDFEDAKAETKTLADYTFVKEGATTAEFLITIAQDILSDGKAHQVSIQSKELPAEFQHISVPKLDRDAFLLARVTDWESLNLLPGKANIFFEGTYVAETNIDPSYTSDTLEFSLGRDKKVVIQREQLQDFTRTRTLGPNREKTYGYEITIRNNKQQPVNLRLEDQIPISQDKDITIKVLENSNANQNPDTGKLSWDLKLEPSQTLKLRLVFQVKYPKSKSISGL